MNASGAMLSERDRAIMVEDLSSSNKRMKIAEAKTKNAEAQVAIIKTELTLSQQLVAVLRQQMLYWKSESLYKSVLELV